jgi:hypothetical protein
MDPSHLLGLSAPAGSIPAELSPGMKFSVSPQLSLLGVPSPLHFLGSLMGLGSLYCSFGLFLSLLPLAEKKVPLLTSYPLS